MNLFDKVEIDQSSFLLTEIQIQSRNPKNEQIVKDNKIKWLKHKKLKLQLDIIAT